MVLSTSLLSPPLLATVPGTRVTGRSSYTQSLRFIFTITAYTDLDGEGDVEHGVGVRVGLPLPVLLPQPHAGPGRRS